MSVRDTTSWLMPCADENIEAVARRAEAFTALLIRFAEAESLVDRGGTTKKLEQDAWCGV